MKNKKSIVSIIIPAYNNLFFTKKCLESIYKHTELNDVEIIVVDNASSDKTRKFLKSERKVVPILNDTNLNFSGANNQAAKIAQGDLLIFLNNDTEVRKNWLIEIKEALNRNKNAGAVGVKLLFPDGTIQHAGVAISEDKIPRHIYYRSNPNKIFINKERPFQVLTAACLAVPKRIFNEVGGFDEEYVNGLEDADLCLKIREKGYDIIFSPKSVVIHHEGLSSGRFSANTANTDIFMKRWKNKMIPDEHKIYKEDGFSLLYVLFKDISSMAYGRDRYHTKPIWVNIMKWVYIPLYKIFVIFSYLFKGDLSGLFKKIRKITNAKS
jgi:GT2 family glycosyltransferase